jgi:predicted RNase H-like HicB family nuclease
MFAEYLDKAMQHAQIEQIEDGTYFGSIPGFQGVWSNAAEEDTARRELHEVLEGWILLQIAD